MAGRSALTTLAICTALIAGSTGPGTASARAQEGLCVSAPVPAASAPARPLRFGITPQLAGTAGSSQGKVAAEDPKRALNALGQLQPHGRRLVIRLNRLFMSEGQAGIDRFTALARTYDEAGFDVESQVRYHPAAAQNGDLDAWERFVREATAALAAVPGLVALTITNEVNLPLSANTSDGAFKGATEAIVRGIPAARDELDRHGRNDVKLGFSYAYRYLPQSDATFWREIGERATPAFRAALDHVGIQLYPGLFFPPVLLPGESAGDATAEAIELLRHCWMPLAGLGDSTRIWISENGYPTNLGHTADGQVRDLRSTVEDVHRLSGTLGVTDYRYFNLRDNRPNGTDLFDDVGLLRADYSEKPAFAAYRDLVDRLGTDPPPRTCARSIRLPRLRRGDRYRRVGATVGGRHAEVRLVRRSGRRPLAEITVPRGSGDTKLIARSARGRRVVVSRAGRPCP